MTKQIIVGAGLGGLYTANRLLNHGIDPCNIILIDPRAGIYTRPGHLNPQAFNLISQFTGISTIGHSTANHIKELERHMYNKLAHIGVTFIKESFVGLQAQGIDQAKAVITQKNDGSLESYPADFVFDCTGGKACVAQAVNRHQQKIHGDVFFKSSAFTEINPITDHLVAQVIIPNSNYLNYFFTIRETIKAVPLRFKSSLENIIAREQLQSLGWLYEAFPTFYYFPQLGTQKICLYMETPPDLPKGQQQAWIKLLLTIYSNGEITDYSELKISEKYDNKPRIMGFKSTPHLLTKAVFQSDDLPVVFIGFDALKGFDYRIANGVISGISCCELMLNNISIDNGNIINVDSDAIDHALFNEINGVYKAELIGRLNSRQEAIENGYEYFSEIYADAAVNLDKSESEKKRRYQLIAGELGYQAALFQFERLKSRDRAALISIRALNKCLSALIRASCYLPANNTSAHHDINNKLQSLIHELRLEISALDIEQIISNRYIRSTPVKVLFESIKKNFEHLDGTFSNIGIQKKSSALIDKIDQQQAFSAPHSHQSLLDSDLGRTLFPFLLPGLYRETQSPVSSFFFIPARQSMPLSRNLLLGVADRLISVSERDPDEEENSRLFSNS